MVYPLNYTFGLAMSPPSLHLLFGVHILLFLLIIVIGFLMWTVIRITDKLHSPVNCMTASLAGVNCVLGSASVLTGTVNIAGNGYWWFGRESCTLLHSLDTCLQCGAILTQASIMAYTMIQFTKPAIYRRYISPFKRLIPIIVWCTAIAQASIAMVISNGAFYTAETSAPLWMCTHNGSTKGNALFMTLSSFVIPIVLIVGIYACLLAKLYGPLDKQVRPKVGGLMNVGARRARENWEDMDLDIMSVRETRQCWACLPTVRCQPGPGTTEEGMLPSEEPTSRGVNPVALPSSSTPSSALGSSELKQLIKCPLQMTPDMPDSNNSSLGKMPDVKKSLLHKKLSQISSLSNRMTLPNLPDVEQALSSDVIQRNAASLFPLSSNVAGLPEPDFHYRERKDQPTPDMNDKENLKRPKAGPIHGRAGAQREKPAPLTKDQVGGRNTDQSVKFLYQRQELPKDSDLWPTVFLTADTVDQEHHVSWLPGIPRSASCSNCNPAPYSASQVKTNGNQVGVADPIKTTGVRETEAPLKRQETYLCDDIHFNSRSFLLLLIPHTLLWLPHHIMLMMISTDTIGQLDFVTYAIIETIGKVTMLLNPFLYLMSHKDFRRSLYCILKCRDPNHLNTNETEEDYVNNSGEKRDNSYGNEMYDSGKPQNSKVISDPASISCSKVPLYMRKVSILYNTP